MPWETSRCLQLGTQASPIPDDRIADGAEEVRDNRAAFDYIVKNELWYQEGVLKKAAQPGGIQFRAWATSLVWSIPTD